MGLNIKRCLTVPFSLYALKFISKFTSFLRQVLDVTHLPPAKHIHILSGLDSILREKPRLLIKLLHSC